MDLVAFGQLPNRTGRRSPCTPGTPPPRARWAASMARRPDGRTTTAATTRNVTTPEATSTASTVNLSASGPKTTMPASMATAMTMPTNPNTRPCISCSTASCSTVIDVVEKNGTARPMTNMKPKNTRRFVDRPRATESPPKGRRSRCGDCSHPLVGALGRTADRSPSGDIPGGDGPVPTKAEESRNTS